jgi:hypothetical protein
MSPRPHNARAATRVSALCLLCVLVLHAMSASGFAAPFLTLSPRNLPASHSISGSPLRIAIGSDTSVQVYYNDSGQVYGWQDASGDSGIWLRVGGDIYGPDACSSGRSTTNMYTVRPWAAVSHVGPSGSGSAGDPWIITTVLDAGTTGIRVTQRASYVNGQNYFRLDWLVANTSGASQAVTLFHAVDSYFANDDYGRGYHDPASGAVGGYVPTGPWYMLFVPVSPATAYREGWYFDIWADIGYCGDNQTCPVSGACDAGPGFDNTIDTSSQGVDNGFGLEWQRTLGAGASTTVSDWWTFGNIPVVPGEEPSPTPTPTRTTPPPVTPTSTWTRTATATPTRSVTVTPGGCGLTPPETGTVVRTLAYHQITTFPEPGAWADFGASKLSADGRRVVFTRYYDPTKFWVMNADGSSEPLLVDTRSGTEGIYEARVDISADGSRVITTGMEKNYHSVRGVYADGSGSHAIIGCEGYPFFRLSGDGTQVFFMTDQGFSVNSQGYPAGLYAVSWNGGTPRTIVTKNQVAAFYGVNPDDFVHFTAGSQVYFDVSHDGSRLVFGTAVSTGGARVMRVNGDGSGLAEHPVPQDYYVYIHNVALSGDGSKLVYLAQRSPCCSAPCELKALNWDGSGSATQLTDYCGPNTNSSPIQLTSDGSKANYLGALYNTDGSGGLELAIPGPSSPTDPPLLVNKYGLYAGTMNSSGTRFLYGADYNAGPVQLATVDLDPPGLGLAPAVTDPKIAPPYVLADGSSAATVRAGVNTSQTLVRVNGVSLRDGFNDSTVLNGGTILLDDGTQGDVTPGDGVLTSNRVWASDPAPLGPRLIRVKAEVRAGDGKRHATAIDVAQVEVVSEAPPGMATCTPTPTRTNSPTVTHTPTWTRTPTLTSMRTQTPTPSSGTATASATRTRTLTPTVGLPDLTISHLEVNQAIQDTENGITLIAYKRTVVRGYINLVSSMPIGRVTGQLRGYRGSTLLGTVDPFNPGGRITVVQPPDWRQINHTLNFEVPFAWLTGDVQLQVEVNNDRKVAENNYGNNVGSVNIRFVDSGDLRIAWLPIRYVTSGYSGPNDPSTRIAKGDAWLKATHPVSHTRVKYYPWPGITWGGDVNAGTGGIKLLNYLNRLLQLSQTRPKPDHVYGWLPGGVFWGNGLGWFPGHTAFGNDTDGRWRRTLTHELGHNRNIGHWDATIRQHGFNVAERMVEEETKLDFMVPGRLESEAWVAPEIYTYLHDKMGASLADTGYARAVAAEYLLVSGMINKDGTGSFEVFYRQAQADPLENPPPGTEYCLELYDGPDTRLSTDCFDVSFDFGDSTIPMTTAPFALTVPFPPATRRIVLMHGTTVVASRTVSNNAPTVSVSLPIGGVVKIVNWTASDLDGDSLSYSLLYSADNKQSWFALATDLTATTYSLDTSQLPGGTNAFVRILATDGVNTGEGDAGPFTVAGNPPTALINAPADGATYMPGESVLFTGDGFDLEDGSLSDAALTWTSSLDGVLGTGGTLERSDLRPGSHLITLTVRDSASNEATASISLNIRSLSCPGDCTGNGEVTVDELITLVNIALGSAELSACPAGNANGDSIITVDEIILAVNAALGGCPAQ